jgi:hypothetical protein
MRTHDDDGRAVGAEEREKKRARRTTSTRRKKWHTQDFHKWLRKIEKFAPWLRRLRAAYFDFDARNSVWVIS